jgi:hypothetical protein
MLAFSFSHMNSTFLQLEEGGTTGLKAWCTGVDPSLDS